jgi:rubrerythrin
MRFEQVRTVLQKLAPEYHRRVSAFYQGLLEADVSPRVRLLLEYLVDHERDRALALEEFCSGMPQPLLDHWVKGVEVHFPKADVALIDSAASCDIGLLIKSAALYKTLLIDYYTHLLEKNSEKDVVKLFESLKSQEEKALKRMIRHEQGLSDL